VAVVMGRTHPDRDFVGILTLINKTPADQLLQNFGVVVLPSQHIFVCPRHGFKTLPTVDVGAGMHLCSACLVDRITSETKKIPPLVAPGIVYKAMKPVHPPISTNPIRTIEFCRFVDAYIRNPTEEVHQQIRNKIPPGTSEETIDIGEQVLDCGVMMNSHAMQMFVQTVNQFLKHHMSGAYVFEEGYTAEILGSYINPQTQSLSFHDNAAKSIRKCLEAHKKLFVYNRNQPLIFTMVEQVHWTCMVVHGDAVYAYNSMVTAEQETEYKRGYLPFFQTAIEFWGSDLELEMVVPRRNVHQDSSDEINCGFFVIGNILTSLFPAFKFDSIEMLRAIVYCTIVYKRLPFV